MPEDALPPVPLHAREEGTGPAVVLLHGVGLSHAIWNKMVPALSQEFRVIAPDLRGHGATPGPDGSHYTLAELEGDVLKLLDDHGIDTAYLVGLSGGALLALRLTLDHPERVRGLVMVCGSAYVDTHTRSIVQRWIDTYRDEGVDAFGLRLLKDLYYPDWIEAHLDFADLVRESVKHQDFGPAEKWNAGLSRFDEKARIPSIRLPTLIVQAMDDQVVDASHGRILRQSIPGAQIRILPETGHMVPLERPAEAVESISGFVRAAEAARAAAVSK
ncbi:MAG TPA: alpha/beta fold hydrolase [Thermoplasmata archaeon]|nr:alpha/beta fold hydrolase [Thermoplasmata archaeon]